MAPGVAALIGLRTLLVETDPARRDLVDRLFGSEASVPGDELRRTLGPPVIECLTELGLVRDRDGRFEPLIRLDRVGRLLIASDLRRRRRQADFVAGPGPASLLLARHVRRTNGGRVLDLGSGSGVQGLLLATRGGSVTAIEISPRAIAFGRFNAALNGLRRVETHLGDFLGADVDEGLDGRYDTVVANPPFVLAPTHRLTYRDRPLPGDLASQQTIERVGRALAPGGRGYVLCNWIDRDGSDWAMAPRRWIEPSGLDAVSVRVATLSAAEYATVWTRDTPPDERSAAIATWTAALEAEGVLRVHIGLVALGRRSLGSGGTVRFTALDRAVDRVTSESIEAILSS